MHSTYSYLFCFLLLMVMQAMLSICNGWKAVLPYLLNNNLKFCEAYGYK